MNRIKSIQFIDHPVLGDLFLDFTDGNDNIVDTIIIAGENGTGKSSVLDSLYSLMTGKMDFSSKIEMVIDNKNILFDCQMRQENGRKNVYVYTGRASYYSGDIKFIRNYKLYGIFSDVDINFNSNELTSVTSMNLDSGNSSRRSTNDLPKQINQLLIDIQALDDADLSKAFRDAKENGMSTDLISISERMPRFTNAFNYIFDDLKYDRVDNINGHKVILFKKNGIDIPVKDLSSGEKQIVYRGSFLLKDIHAMNGAYVFIDEPEISMHPKWQEKIMEYYKQIFTDANGIQTSQIFAVTHSPFIIHNCNRKNDKVIVLGRDETGKIIVKDKPSYYKCNSIEAVEDAFSVIPFSERVTNDKSSVFLEGRTDEKYFNKALEVYDYKDLPFEFKWVGYVDLTGNEQNTGCSSLNNAYKFLVSQNYQIKNACLFDCDTNRSKDIKNNTLSVAMPTYENGKNMKKGIENALVLDNIEISNYYSTKTKQGDYGEITSITTFEKMKFCDYLCNEVDNEMLKTVFANLKTQIDELIEFFNGGKNETGN